MAFYDNFLDDSHRLTRDTCRRFAEREIAPFAFEWEEAGGFPRELFTQAGEQGLLGIGFEESAGGSGGDALHMVMLIEGMMRGGSTGVSISLWSCGIALPPIIQSRNDMLIERFVRPTLRGELIAALGVTEPDTGSDVAGVSTRATRDGDDYIISGAKIFITSGVRADFLTTLVRTGEDPHGGLSFIIVEMDRPGVRVSAPLKKTGWWASDTAEIGFDDVRVPASNLVGREGSAFVTLMRNFQTERLALAAYGAATAEIALEEAQRYAKERQAFGRPIGAFQVNRHKLVDMATRVMAAKTCVYQVATRMAAGDPCLAQVSMAKNLCAETAVSVTYDAVQLHGGMGYMRESLVERLSRDARVLPIGGGTQEIMKEIAAKALGI